MVSRLAFERLMGVASSGISPTAIRGVTPSRGFQRGNGSANRESPIVKRRLSAQVAMPGTPR